MRNFVPTFTQQNDFNLILTFSNDNGIIFTVATIPSLNDWQMFFVNTNAKHQSRFKVKTATVRKPKRSVSFKY